MPLSHVAKYLMTGFMVVIECLIFVYLQVEHSEQCDKENGLTILPN